MSLRKIGPTQNSTSIGMTIMGDTQITIRRFARVSNEAHDNGMCIATYNVQELKNCGAGESFKKAYNSVKTIAVYHNPHESDEMFLFNCSKVLWFSSIMVTSFACRDAASKPKAPEPAYKSRHFA